MKKVFFAALMITGISFVTSTRAHADQWCKVTGGYALLDNNMAAILMSSGQASSCYQNPTGNQISEQTANLPNNQEEESFEIECN